MNEEWQALERSEKRAQMAANILTGGLVGAGLACLGFAIAMDENEVWRPVVAVASFLCTGIVIASQALKMLSDMPCGEPESEWVGATLPLAEISHMDLADGENPEDWKIDKSIIEASGKQPKSIYVKDVVADKEGHPIGEVDKEKIEKAKERIRRQKPLRKGAKLEIETPKQ